MRVSNISLSLSLLMRVWVGYESVCVCERVSVPLTFYTRATGQMGMWGTPTYNMQKYVLQLCKEEIRMQEWNLFKFFHNLSFLRAHFKSNKEH